MNYVQSIVVITLLMYTVTTYSVAQNVYSDVMIDQLLKAQESQDNKEAALTKLLTSAEDEAMRANLYCRRGSIRVTHTHLPKGIEDLEVCLNILNALGSDHSQAITKTQQQLDFAKQKQAYTLKLLNDPKKPLLVHFTAMWKLGERNEAVKLVKAKAKPEIFSSLSTNRMVKTGYLCEGSSPLGPNKSFRTKQAGPFWWCDELPTK